MKIEEFLSNLQECWSERQHVTPVDPASLYWNLWSLQRGGCLLLITFHGHNMSVNSSMDFKRSSHFLPCRCKLYWRRHCSLHVVGSLTHRINWIFSLQQTEKNMDILMWNWYKLLEEHLPVIQPWTALTSKMKTAILWLFVY